MSMAPLPSRRSFERARRAESMLEVREVDKAVADDLVDHRTAAADQADVPQPRAEHQPHYRTPLSVAAHLDEYDAERQCGGRRVDEQRLEHGELSALHVDRREVDGVDTELTEHAAERCARHGDMAARVVEADARGRAAEDGEVCDSGGEARSHVDVK